MNTQQFSADVLPMLSNIFAAQGKPAPSSGVIALWVDALARFDSAIVRDALRTYVSEPAAHYGLPQPNDIALLIEGSSEERGTTAWQKVLGAIRSKSGWATVAFDDPAIHATIKHMGGWITLTLDVDADSRERIRREFELNYRTFAARGVPPGTPPRLPGLLEESCVRLGRHYAGQVQLIGDPRRAGEIANSGTQALLSSPPPTQALPTGGARHG
jgi:hypothetical protein